MSLRAAARELGVSSGAVYRHFCDKDELMTEVAHHGFQDLSATFYEIRPEGAVAADAHEAAIRAFRMGRAFVDFAHRNPTLWRMMFGRIGVLCREKYSQNPEFMRYTIRDVVHENARDLFNAGGMATEPTLDDIRFLWSAIHGAADLTQSGLRLDETGQDAVADQTTLRSLRALGCDEAVLAAAMAGLETAS
ncbi:TetR/AcrR family transcriptional regulator [Oceanibium sediminis]|uniref:TetR/AcrR family transcriptional regulator n=1 Tax=Oceanibium sediminis TaxID=2026339 RepID=UPI001E4F29BA|nr:TetR/AcrR family transcriptional regulator [Oceanibium sediminis]